MPEEVKREKVPVGLHAGRSPWAIAEFNEHSLSFVYQMKRKLQISEHPRGYGHRTPYVESLPLALTQDFVARVQKLVDQDPRKSIRSSRGAVE